MRKAREAASLDFNGATHSFFPDLARETLEGRRALQPVEREATSGLELPLGLPSGSYCKQRW